MATPSAPRGWDEPLDNVDDNLLDEVRTAWSDTDPMPAVLIDQVRLTLGLVDVDIEMLALVEPVRSAATRNDGALRRITFSGDDLTIMINIDCNTDGMWRIDGWMAPAVASRVELRTGRGLRVTESGEDGRFSIDAIPKGLVQLVIHQSAGGATRTFTTPTVEL